ncbi:hypothetical protein T484DRAFT_1973862 [Baffinella frigidus]|nr:hypothetical protein T484DRAFT_1973862 [Cryptophyta sp. CCMP2293]
MLCETATEQDLIDLMETVGTVTSVKMLTPHPRFHTCMAFVNLMDDASVAPALALHGTVPSWNQGIALQISGKVPEPEERQPRLEAPEKAAVRDTGSKAKEAEAKRPDARTDGPRVVGQWTSVLSRTVGKMYWKHGVSGKTQWEVPTEVAEIDAISARAAAAAAAAQAAEAIKGRKMRSERVAVKREGVANVEEEDSGVCDDEGYWDDEDRENMMRLPMLEREMILADRMEERDRRRGERKMLKQMAGSSPAKGRARGAVREGRGDGARAGGEKKAPVAVGDTLRFQREEGWRQGLVVQARTQAGGEAMHRMVWEDGREDEWVALQRETYEPANQARAAPAKARVTAAAARKRREARDSSEESA